ncbi:flagellar motor switch phosphatase FliY [Alkalicoccus luteus]|nr:flagellar motor switch phosphatase FliY [Alkalicoccus luteus]
MMNDDMLSQDEINELLNGLDEEEPAEASEKEPEQQTSADPGLDAIEEDALGEIGNIAFGSSATALSTLLNQKVDITTPKVQMVERGALQQEFPKPHVAISVEYTEGFEGVNLLVIKTKDAAIIADLMMGNEGTDVEEQLGEMEMSAVQEAMNQMMGSASTSMSTIFNQKVDISPPGISIMDLQEDPGGAELPDEDQLVQISFDLKIGTLIDSKIMQLFTLSFAKDMVQKLMNPAAQDIPDEVIKAEPAETPAAVSEPDTEQVTPERKPEPRTDHQPQHVGSKYPQREADVHEAAFTDFSGPQLSDQETRNLEMLMEIPLEVTVELGRTKRSIKDILEFSKGSIVELDKLAGEPVDILVNQRLIAKGEVVVIDENFGVRVLDIVSKEDRMKNLRG